MEQETERVAQLKQERKSALEHQKRLARMSQVNFVRHHTDFVSSKTMIEVVVKYSRLR